MYTYVYNTVYGFPRRFPRILPICIYCIKIRMKSGFPPRQGRVGWCWCLKSSAPIEGGIFFPIIYTVFYTIYHISYAVQDFSDQQICAPYLAWLQVVSEFEIFILSLTRQPPEFVISINWSRTSLMQRWEVPGFFRRVQLGQVNTSKHLLLVILNRGNGWYMLHGWYIGCFCRKDSEWFSGIIEQSRIRSISDLKKTVRDNHFSRAFWMCCWWNRWRQHLGSINSCK